jgi:MYXO-CTERM domain-containing protein
MKTVLAVGTTMFAVGCSGGGCSSCAGSSVIPGGFPKDQRIENAAGVRLTRPGLDFLQSNIGPIVAKVMGSSATGGVMTFPIPKSDACALNLPLIGCTLTIHICPDGPKTGTTPPECLVELDLAKIKNTALAADKPQDFKISAKIPVRLQELPITGLGTMHACITSNFSDSKQWVDMPVTVDISLETVPNDAVHAVRAGYTKINIKSVNIDQNTLNSNIGFCGGGVSSDILNFLKGAFIGSLTSGLTSQLTGPLASATCMKEVVLPDGTKQCPTGTFDRGGTCRYADNDSAECVPMVLGMESRFDLSGLLASISPGTKGGLDFLLAAGGAMDPAPGTSPATNGATLHMLGGALPQPVSDCVPKADNPIPMGIQLPPELTANSITPWPAAPAPAEHLGIGVSEKFLNFAATSAYNSGLFCIGVSSEQVSQLDASLFSLLIPSMAQVSDNFNTGASHPAMALAIRPQKAPKIVIGDNTDDFKSPLIGLTLPQTDLDFYMWSENRFIRLFTGTIDIGVPLNLEAGPAGIQIKLPPKNPISFSNPKISNNKLLLEDDAALGKVVEGIGGVIPASTFNNIKPISLDSALASVGLKLTIPKEGIRKATNTTTGDNFLGIFASLEVATAAMPTTVTTARIARMDVDPANYVLKTFGSHQPDIFVHAESSEDNGTKSVEYAYQVDSSAWTTWNAGRDFRLVSPFLNLQGKHTVKVASRVVGQVDTEGEPVTIPFILDTLAPRVVVANAEAGQVRIAASDYVSTSADLKVEARLVDDKGAGTWVEVKPTSANAGAGVAARNLAYGPEIAAIEVKVTDEAGNVASTSSALIRGRADKIPGAASSGCGCSTPGSGQSSNGTGALVLASLAALGAVVERRRRRSRAMELATATMFVSSAGAMGCSCGGSSTETPVTPTPPVVDERPPVVSYVIGSYTSAATAKDGTVWVAGYNEGDPSTGDPNDFSGDLVVGKLGTDGTVNWAAVDGVPTDVKPTRNAGGFRGGIQDPGDDVGLFTSIVVDATGNPIVAYYDRTNFALKVARFDGKSWSSHQVEAATTGWAGKYTSMVLVDGKPVVAYQVIEPGTAGWTRAKVRIARATSASPASSSDWTFEDAVKEEQTPCFNESCSLGTVCLAAATGIDPICAQETSGCAAGCSNKCVKSPADGKPACLATKPAFTAYPNAVGLDISLAVSPSGALGLVFYDRQHGNLRGATFAGGSWKSTPATAPIDGWTGDVVKDAGKGDRGIGATLAIDATGTWHVAYSDGIAESLLYTTIPVGDFTKVTAPIVVDDGRSSDGTTKFSDGQHVVGENANLSVDSGGVVHIVYQDSTSDTLRWAKGPGGAAAKFTRGVLTQDGAAGFWPKVVGSQVLNFYRLKGLTDVAPDSGNTGDPVVLGNVRALPLP